MFKFIIIVQMFARVDKKLVFAMLPVNLDS